MKQNMLVLLLSACIFTAKAQGDKIPENQIKQAIQTFVALVDSQNLKEFGLQSMA